MNWQDLLQNVLYSILLAAVPVITNFIVQYLRAAATKITEVTNQTHVKNTVNAVLDIIVSAVACTSQTYVESLKKEGTFTKESQEVAFSLTKDKVLSQLSEESKLLLSTLYKDVDGWIDTQIEASVKNIKLLPANTVSPISDTL